MITLTILVAILLGVIVLGIILLLSGGISLLLTFGDVIVAGLIIYAIVKHIYKNHHKNQEGPTQASPFIFLKEVQINGSKVC